jgi:hypothetical protein
LQACAGKRERVGDGEREEEGEEEGRVEAVGEEEARDTDKIGKMGELLRDWHVCEAEKSPADGDADADSGRTFRRASSLVDELTELARSEGLDGRVELAVGTYHPAGGLGLVLRGHSPPRVVGLLSAAALSGMVQVGDELASIDGIRANGMGIEELTALMAGDVGTRCTLSLIRRSELVEVTLERREMSRSRGLGISFTRSIVCPACPVYLSCRLRTMTLKLYTGTRALERTRTHAYTRA